MEIIKIDKTQGNLVFDLFNKYRIFYKQESDIELAKKFIQLRLDNNESIIFVAVVNDKSKSVGFTQLYPKYSSAIFRLNSNPNPPLINPTIPPNKVIKNIIAKNNPGE
jgi:hypothetical protein